MIKVRVSRPLRSILSPLAATFSLLLVLAGCGSVGPGDDNNCANGEDHGQSDLDHGRRHLRH